MRSLVLGLTIAVLSSVAFGRIANAEERGPVIRISIMALTPYGFFDEQKKPKGDVYAIAEAFLKTGNFDGSVTIQPVKRIAQTILTKKTSDCMLVGNVPYIAKNYSMIAPIGYDLKFGVLPRKEFVINQYLDLSPLRIGVPLGVNIGHPFDSDDTMNKISIRDYDTGMRMLRRGRIDGIAGVISSLEYSGRINGITSAELGFPYVINQLSFWFVCRPGFASTALEDSIKRTILRLRKDGTIDRIVQRYREH